MSLSHGLSATVTKEYCIVLYRGVDPYGTGGTRPPNICIRGTLPRMPPPQYFYSNISYFLSMQYFLDKLKEFLVFLVFSRLVQGVVGTL